MTNASTASGRELIDARALVRAAGEPDASRVESLLRAGADVNSATESGETPLIRAASKGHAAVVRALLAAGSDPNAEREDGFTALGVAVFFGYADVVQALLEGGADPSAKGRLGASAEKWARFSGFEEIAVMLRSATSGAQASAAGGEESGAHAFFPAEGTFSPVVPLSELHASPSSEGVEPAATAEVDERVSPLVESEELEPKEVEVITVIRPRAGSQTTPQQIPTDASPSPADVSPASDEELASPPARAEESNATFTSERRAAPPKGFRQPWRLTATVLALSLSAGMAAGWYLMSPRTPAAPAPSAAPAEPPLASEAESSAAPPAPDAADTAGASERDTSAEDSPTRQAPQAAPPESRRADVEAAPPPRRESEAGAQAARRVEPPAAKKADDAPRETQAPAPRRVRRSGGPVLTSSPRDNSLPVFSPSPSGKSGRKKVIPWP